MGCLRFHKAIVLIAKFALTTLSIRYHELRDRSFLEQVEEARLELEQLLELWLRDKAFEVVLTITIVLM